METPEECSHHRCGRNAGDIQTTVLQWAELHQCHQPAMEAAHDVPAGTNPLLNSTKGEPHPNESRLSLCFWGEAQAQFQLPGKLDKWSFRELQDKLPSWNLSIA